MSTDAPKQYHDADLPFRLRESTFRLYEGVIAACLVQWPEPYTFNPAPLRATTVAARLRDALLSLSRFRWPTAIDMLVFDDLYNAKLIVVAHADQNVAIGPRAKRSVYLRSGFQPVSTAESARGIEFAEGRWEPADLTAICQLLGSKLVSGPVHVRPPLDASTIDKLEQRYDIAVASDDTKTTLI